MLPRPPSLLQLLLLASVARAQWQNTADPFVPPSIPLAVRTPYLQTWLPQGTADGSLNSGWAAFRDNSIIAWLGMILVDNVSCNWMGIPGTGQKAVEKSMSFTATQTIITTTCGSVDITATFLSPIEPTDFVKQSIPFSYLSVQVAANDGMPHQVHLYTDVSGEWLAESDLPFKWETPPGGTIIHNFWLQNSGLRTEVNGRIRDGSVMYATKQVDGTTYMVGDAEVLRPLFTKTGVLNNTVDPQFRNISDRWPVFAFAHDLGTIGTTKTTPIVYTIGFVREVLVQLSNLPNANSVRGPYYLTRYSSFPGVVAAFLDDWPNATARATDFDKKLTADALTAMPKSSDYADILALSVRQLFGTIELTSGFDGTTHVATDIMAFMRDGYTNTVDMIYSAWPAFLYTYPAIGRYLLEPVLAYQAASSIQGGYSIHDIGALYPNVTGPSSESYPVEESGNQLIMALSYTQKTSDNSLITKYKSLYDQFGNYLVQNGLYPASQFSGDSYAGALANQTNLAVKSIIAIRAASEIFRILGDNDKSQQYNNTATDYLQKWLNDAPSSDKSHYTLTYGNNPSWGLLYNLYADRLLGFNMFPQSVYQTQTTWYSNHLDDYGIRLDSRSSDAKTDWQIWTAATLTDDTLRTSMVSRVKKFASSRKNSSPFPDRYDSENGTMVQFSDRASVGGHFALLLVPNVVGSTSSSGGGNGNGGGDGGNNGSKPRGAAPTIPALSMVLMLFVTLIYALI